MNIPPQIIVLSGGGIRCLSHIGALLELDRRKYLGHVKEYVGVSAGAFISFALCIGYTIRELHALILGFNFFNLQNIDPDNIINFLSVYGIDDGKQLEKLIHTLLKYKGLNSGITFMQLYTLRPQITFRCYASDLNTCTLKEFSHILTPNTSVVFALRCSTCVPGYFTPLKDPDTGHYLLDGGLVSNYPFKYVDQAKNILGISISREHTVKTKIDTIYEYFMQVYTTYSMSKRNNELEKNMSSTIMIPSSELQALNFNISTVEKEKLVAKGVLAVQEFFNAKVLALKQRRNSL